MTIEQEIKNITFNIRTDNDEDLLSFIDYHTGFNLLTRIYTKFLYECYFKQINIASIVSGLSSREEEQIRNALYDLIIILKNGGDKEFRGYSGFFYNYNFGGLCCANFNNSNFNAAINKLQINPNCIEDKSIIDALYPSGPGSTFSHLRWVKKDKTKSSGWSIDNSLSQDDIKNGIDKLISSRNTKVNCPTNCPLCILKSFGLKGKLLPMIGKNASDGFELAAFAKAIAKLKTFITNSNKRIEERKEQKKQLSIIEKNYSNNASWKLLNNYQNNRSTQLGKSFKINFAQLKGWKNIRKLWLQSNEDKHAVLFSYQKENPENFGDNYLFEWLINNPSVWKNEDLPTELAKYNDLSLPLKGITFTLPDPIKHPEWVFFADGGNSNQSKCGEIIPNNDNTFECLISVRQTDINDQNKITKKVKFALSRSKRLVRVKEHSNFKLKLNYFDKSGKSLIDCEVGGVHIEIDRGILSSIKYDLNKLDQLDMVKFNSFKDEIVNLIFKKLSQIKKNFHNLKLSCAVEVPIEEIKNKDLGLTKNKEDKTYFINPKTTKSLDKLDNQKIISIDLGQKDAIAYAITKVVLNDEYSINIDNKYGLDILKTGIFSSKDIDFSHTKNLIWLCKTCCEMQNAIVSNIKGLANKPKDLQYYINKIKTITAKEQYFYTENIEQDDLQLLFIDVNHLTKKIYNDIASYFNDKINRCQYGNFVSFRYLDLLEQRLILEKKFSTRWQFNHNTKQFYSKQSFDFLHIKKLQDHINFVKLDRCKKIARTVVNLALHNYTNIIVLEKLDIKRTQSNTKRINKNLHTWSVRTIIDFIKQFAKMHAICVGEVHPAYTSQYAAKTGEKGKRYYRDGNILKPSQFGDVLITKSGTEHNANINAAINIALKFFGKKITPLTDDEKENINAIIDELVGRRYNSVQVA